MADDPFANVPDNEWDALRQIAGHERAKRARPREESEFYINGDAAEPPAPPPEAYTNGADSSQRRFKLIRFNEIKLATTAYYLINRLIPREGIIVIWGPPKCGKSFWTFDALMHIALGRKYRGRRVSPGGVVYVACEGERGLGARVAAFKVKHGIEDSDPNFYLVTTQLNLVTDFGQLIRDIRDQIGKTVVVAIVIDTLNRSIIGDENSAQDMGVYLKAADAVRADFKCALIVIHHCGVDGTRPRGSSALPGFVEAQLAVKRDEGGLVTVTVEYMKDGQEGEAVQSRLEVVELGQDDENEDITSCVIVPAEEEAASTSGGPRLSPACSLVLEALRAAIVDAGAVPPANNHIPAGIKAVPLNLWRDYAYARDLSDGGPDARRKAFKRAAEQLQARGLVGCWQDRVWPS